MKRFDVDKTYYDFCDTIPGFLHPKHRDNKTHAGDVSFLFRPQVLVEMYYYEILIGRALSFVEKYKDRIIANPEGALKYIVEKIQ
jgi:hypothetical protein